MATINEQFRDVLMRRQIALAHFERGLTNDVVSLLDSTEKELRMLLATRLDEITGRDIAGTMTTRRLRVLANSIGKLRGDALGEAGDLWDSSMRELAVTEADFLNTHLKEISPVRLDTVLPDETQLAGIVSVQPMQGRLLEEWVGDLSDLDQRRIMDAIRIGMTHGETTDDITRRVLGSQSMDGADGVLAMTRNDAASLTQTAISTIANESRQQYFEANADVFSKEQWVSTLDDATCEQCGALDGEEFAVGEGEQPPLHFNCRCTRVPVIDGGAIGDRPSNAAFADELEGLDKTERAARISELVGQVPTTTTYSDWLGNQTSAFQDHVLGSTRATLFRDGGMDLSKFVNMNGNRINLSQLRDLEPAAFRRAGLK